MNEVITSGDVCIGLVLSKRLSRDILPNHGTYYKSDRENEDMFRFNAFLRKPVAAVLEDCLNQPFDPDGLSVGL